METKREMKKEEKIKLVEEFYEEYGRLPKYLEKYKGKALGAFLNSIKQRQIKITEEQLERLFVLGFDLKVKEGESEKLKKIKLVEEFYEEHGRLPSWKQIYKGEKLGIFLSSIRRGFTKLTKEQLERLKKIGFVVEKKDIKGEKIKKIELVEEFYEEYGRFPTQSEKYKGVAIGTFLNSIKQGTTKLTEEQLERLFVLGFDLKIQDKEAEKAKKIELVEEFYEEYGRFPKRLEMYKREMIGKFLNSINQGQTRLTEEQMERLTKLGFQGQTNDIKVERKIDQIEKFYEEHGRLPEQDESLGREKPKVGEFLLSIRIGKIRITEKQFLRLQQMDVTLTREQVKFIEKTKVKVKK